MPSNRSGILLAAALSIGSVTLPLTVAHAASVSLPLATGPGNKLDLGFFTAGTTITFSFGGNGDLVDSRYQVNADGSLFAAATGVYSYANNGAAYSQAFGGDGINHYVGGGANFDSASGQAAFAGKLSTDTTDPATIRFGAVVATFVGAPVRADWLYVGTGATLVAPAGGANLYLAVNDVTSGNEGNHGTYTGTYALNAVAVPEANSFALVLPALGMIGAVAIRRRKG